MNALKLMMAAAALFSVSSAWCACQDDDVAGLPTSDGQCLSDSMDAPPSAYAYVDNPPCPSDFGATDISAYVQQQASEAAITAGSDYGGPALGWVAGMTATNVMHSLENLLGRDAGSTTSVCGVLAVKIPKGSTVIAVYGVAQDDTGRTYCGTSNDCGGIGWSAMENQQTSTDSSGTIVSVTAKNWSGDRRRHFELLVYYQ